MKKYLKIIIPFIFLILIILFFYLSSKRNKIELKQEVFRFEYGDKIPENLDYYLTNVNKHKDVNNLDLVIDSNGEVGKHNAYVLIKEKKFEFIVEIIDSSAPVFTEFKNEIIVMKNSSETDILSKFKAKDLSQTSISLEGNYNLKKVGIYNVEVIAVDLYNNKSSKPLTIKVQEKVTTTKKVVDKKPSTTTSTTTKKVETTTKKYIPEKNEEKNISRYREDISNEYVNRINAYRLAKGLTELPVTTETQNEADRRAKELTINYSHDGVGSGFGENIGRGSIGVDFVKAWQESPPHNEAMLREQNGSIAVSVYEHNNYWYAVVSFKMNY